MNLDHLIPISFLYFRILKMLNRDVIYLENLFSHSSTNYNTLNNR